jgi:hypothetical protein
MSFRQLQRHIIIIIIITLIIIIQEITIVNFINDPFISVLGFCI